MMMSRTNNKLRLIPILTLMFMALSLSGSGVGQGPTHSHAAAVMFPYVLPWDDSSDSLTDLSGWNESNAGKNGFIKSVDGHFYSGDKRIRFLGVNTSMGANFPSSSDARKVAARMAKFGINMVRITHLDFYNAPLGILEEDRISFDSDQLKHLDYYIYQLKRKGIYVDLNLHVSREYPGFPEWDGMPDYYKGIDHFYPEMIEMQKDYAETLLTHRNKYTDKRYKDDPVVALIEINNENSLIAQWYDGKLDNMPSVFQNELESQYAQWLAGDTSGEAQAATASGVSMVKKSQFNSLSARDQAKWLEFLYYVEEKYFTEMRDFLKNDIGVGSLVIGTHVGFSLAPIQQNMDVIAVNSYWKHPVFPGGSWDEANWYVPNTPMAGDPDGGKISSIASLRVAGMPLVVTEYCHPAPNTYSSEALLLTSAYAALHDWDGLLVFTYTHRTDDWDPQYITDWFSFDSHPTRMVTFQAAAAMFRRGDVQVAPEMAVAQSSKAQALEITRNYGPGNVNTDSLGLDPMQCLYYRTGMFFSDAAATGRTRSSGLWGKLKRKLAGAVNRDAAYTSTTNELTWNSGSSDGMVTVNTAKSKLFVGYIRERQIDFDGIVVKPYSEVQDWAALSLTVMEGNDFNGPSKILLTATGYVENTNMGWTDSSKTSVANNWGKAPTLVEGIEAAVLMPLSPDSVRVWSLDATGDRDQEIPVTESGGLAYFEIGPKYETLWYEIKIK